MATWTDVSDVANRWRALTSDEVARAGYLIEDAEARLRAECPGLAAKVTAGTVELDLVRAVVSGMVKRALIGGAGEQSGVASVQMGAGPFSQALTYANPTGETYATKADLRLLGYGSQKAFEVDLAPLAGAAYPWLGVW